MILGRVPAVVHSTRAGFHIPAQNGTLVYLNCDPDLQKVLNWEEAGRGNIMQQKSEVAPGPGFCTFDRLQMATGSASFHAVVL